MVSSITKLLVANRGEIAARVLRTAHDMGIDTVAVFADPDADAPHVALADEAVRLPGSAPGETYLKADLIVERALAVGADAVHPGYGFLSENAAFARACLDAGLVFVGPAPDVIAAMGSKVEAKARMAAAGVPVLPGVTLDDATDLAAAAAEVGFPLLVKASRGGGGRGMRVVDRPSAITDAVASARREAREAFGDGEVFLERYVVDPRHVEVQVFGDATGAVVHLFERECSIQRRHQKILEECPSPAVGDALRAELGAAAVAAAEAVGYVGAGTVEFVLDERGDFFFLEMNTRLQVEHPVTEMVTDLDLVELQIRVAEGEALPPEVRSARLAGHAIEARLYAEDVAAGFLPAAGTLTRFELDPGRGVRVDAGVVEGSTVSPYYDPMLAKVVAHGATRRDAARRLARVLDRARLRGVATNRDLLVGILREPGFLAGRTDTGYLTRHDPAVLAHRAPADPRPALVAAAMAQQAAWHAPGAGTRRHTSTAPGRSRFVLGDREIDVGYRLGPGEPRVSVDGETVDDLRLLHVRADTVVLELGGVRRRYRVERDGDAVEVDGPDGRIGLVRLPRLTDPAAAAHEGSLQAPMPGAVLRVLAGAGTAVAAGQPLVVLEAMKMEHTLSTPTAGVLAAVSVAVGDQVDTGQVLALVEPLEGEGTVR